MKKSRVLVIDDSPAWCDFLRSRLENVSGLEVVGQVSDGLEGVRKAEELQPNLILLDIGLPTLNGIEAARQISQCAPTSRILFVSGNRSRDIADAALSTGARGYVTKSDAARELLPAVNAVLRGRRHINPSFSKTLALTEESDGELRQFNKRQVPRVDGCEKIIDAAVAIMHSDFASMQILCPERGSSGELWLLAFRGFNSEATVFWERVSADSKCTCGIALRDRQRVVASDIATCGLMDGSEDQRVCLETGIRACQTTPLISDAGNIVGMLSTHWRTAHQPTEREFLRFDILAKQAADLIERSRSVAFRAPL